MAMWVQTYNEISFEQKNIKNPSICTYENSKYLERIIGNLVTNYKEVIDTVRSLPTKNYVN